MTEVTRRQAIGFMGAATVGLRAKTAVASTSTTTGQYTQSVCQWCYRDIPLRDFFKQVSDLGLTAVDLLQPDEWAIAQEFGLTCSLGYADAGNISGTLVD